MLTVCVTVVLTAVVLAQADQMSDLLHLPAHKDHLYIYDVTSEASVEDLKAALANFTLGGSYKVIGEERYFFRLSSNDPHALHSLTFPKGSAVTQYPVEHIYEYLEMFGAGGWQENYTEKTSPETVLYFLEFRIDFPGGGCSEAFEMRIRETAEGFRKLHSLITPKIYIVLASYPPKGLEFMEMEDNAFQNFLTFAAAAGVFADSVKRIVKI